MNRTIYMISQVLFIASCYSQSIAQQPDLNTHNIIDETVNLEGSAEQQLIVLEELKEERPDINKIIHNDFPDLFCLSETGKEAILNHLIIYGPLLAEEELQVIRQLSKEEEECIKNFFSLPKRSELFQNQNAKSIKCESILHFRKSEIDERSSKWNIRTNSINYRSFYRLRIFPTPNCRIGINAEKDAGEKWWQKNGPDHKGYFIEYYFRKYDLKLIAGDFQFQFGQGLIFSPSAIGGIGGELNLIKQSSAVARPYTSMYENGGMRGIVFSYKKKSIQLFLWGSSTGKDGRINFSPDSSTTYFSPSESGLHRTPSELSTINQYNENNYGLSLILKKEKFRIGILSNSQTTSLPPTPPSEPYQLLKRIAMKSIFASIDYQLNGSRYLLFGETAVSSTSGFATTNGILIHPDRRVSMALNFRAANGKCLSSFSGPFGSDNFLDGGFGYYAGLNLKFNQQSTFILFQDNSIQNWLKYQVNTLQRGSNYGLRYIYVPGKSTECILMVRRSSQLGNMSSNESTPLIREEVSNQLRLQITFKPAFGWQIRYRFEMNTPNISPKTKSISTLIFQDIRYQCPTYPLSINFRSCIFNIDQFDNAIYVQESEPLYNYRSTAHYGKGVNCYILLHTSITKSIDGWLKIGSTKVFDRKFYDDFSNQSGNIKNEFSFQLRWRIR